MAFQGSYAYNQTRLRERLVLWLQIGLAFLAGIASGLAYLAAVMELLKR